LPGDWQLGILLEFAEESLGVSVEFVDES